MADTLKRLRPELNSMFESFRSLHREADAGDVLDFFFRSAVPLFETNTDISDDNIRSMFDEVLNLCGRGFAGRHGRFSVVEKSMFRIIIRHISLLAGCRGFMTSVFNALYNIHEKDEPSMKRWAEAMTAGWHTEDASIFRKLGLVNAWMCGLARYRDEALSVIETSGDEFAGKVSGTPDPARIPGMAALSLMKKDPWYNPAAVSVDGPVFIYSGGHRGLAGNFISIPFVYSRDGIIYAEDRQSVFRVYADCFGMEIVHEPGIIPGDAGVYSAGETAFADGRIISGNAEFQLPGFCSGEVKSIAAAGNTVAWTMNESYRVYIAGLKVHDE